MKDYLKAYYNTDLVGETTEANHGVEIYRVGIDGSFLETIEYRFFSTPEEAEQNARIFNEIRGYFQK